MKNPFKDSKRSHPLEETWEVLFGAKDRELLERMVGSSVGEGDNSLELAGLATFELDEDEPLSLFRKAERKLAAIQDNSIKLDALSDLTKYAADVGLSPKKYLREMDALAWKIYNESSPPRTRAILTLAKSKLAIGIHDLEAEMEILDRNFIEKENNRAQLARAAANSGQNKVAADLLQGIDNKQETAKQIALICPHLLREGLDVEDFLKEANVDHDLSELRYSIDPDTHENSTNWLQYGYLASASSYKPSLTTGDKITLSSDAFNVDNNFPWEATSASNHSSTLHLRLVDVYCKTDRHQMALDMIERHNIDKYMSYQMVAISQAQKGDYNAAMQTVHFVDPDKVQMILRPIAKALSDGGHLVETLETIKNFPRWNQYKFSAIESSIKNLAKNGKPYGELLEKLRTQGILKKNEALVRLAELYRIQRDLKERQVINDFHVEELVGDQAEVFGLFNRHKELNPKMLEEIYHLAVKNLGTSDDLETGLHALINIHLEEQNWSEAQRIADSLEDEQHREIGTHIVLKEMTAYAAQLAKTE